MKLAPITLGRILAGFVFVLAIPCDVARRREWWSAMTATLAFKGPCGRPRTWSCFRKHGLKTEMVLITGSTRAMAALISGSSDFA